MKPFIACSILLFTACSHYTGDAPAPLVAGNKVHATESPHSDELDADEVVRLLIEGNTRYLLQSSRHPHRDAARRASLTEGQKPQAIVLSCSDSRVPPEVVFDQGLGDLFVIRSAGEVADTAGLASIEYAVEHLGTKLIVVLGHTSCGAVKATLTTPPDKSAGSPSLDALVAAIRPNVSGFTMEKAGPQLHYAVEAQVLGTAERLLRTSPIIKEAVAHGHAKIVKAVYHLDTGLVRFLK